MSLMNEFLNSSAEHKETRGVHSAALADGGEMLIFRDDMGRHNAFDKVVGAALLAGMSLEDKAYCRAAGSLPRSFPRCSGAGSPSWLRRGPRPTRP